MPSLGIDFSYYVDELSLLFFLLTTGIGRLILIYGGAYFKGHSDLGRLYVLILLFMTVMLGLVVSDHLIVLFVFWEITSITFYLLIGFKHESLEARTSALRALIITGIGGLALLAGFVLMGQCAGTYKFSELLGKAETIRQSSLYLPILVLVLLAAFTKSDNLGQTILALLEPEIQTPEGVLHEPCQKDPDFFKLIKNYSLAFRLRDCGN